MRVAKSKDAREWPPQESSIGRLIKAAPQCFVLDHQTKQFYLMDADAPLAQARARAQQPPLSLPRTPSPPRSSQWRSARRQWIA